MYRKLIVILLAGILAFAMTACGGGDDEDETATTHRAATKEATEETESKTTEPATKELKVYQKAYKAQVDALIDQYGGKMTGGRLCDMDGDGTPELIAICDMHALIYTMRGEEATEIYEGTIGLRYGQTDAGYEVMLNESISPKTLILFNAKDEWVDENISAVSVSGGEASVKSLKAATDGENDTPAREELKTFSIDGKSLTAGGYEAEYNRLTKGAESIDPYAAGLDDLLTALTQQQ